MKIKFSYWMPVTKELEVCPEEYCKIHASFKEADIPDVATNVKLEIVSGQEELTNFLLR